MANAVGHQLLDERKTASLLDVNVRVLQYWRQVGEGPNFHKIGRFVRYDVAELNKFIDAGLRVASVRATMEESLGAL